jgi:hypothetical protein
MITLQWSAKEVTVTEQFTPTNAEFSIGLCPASVQQKANTEGMPAVLRISTTAPLFTVRHAIAAINVASLHVQVCATVAHQVLTYVTDATRSSFPGRPQGEPRPRLRAGEAVMLKNLTIEADAQASQSTIEIECCVHTLQRESLAVQTRQTHNVPHTRSNVVIRGVSEGVSKVFVDSIITIPEGVPGVSADQVHKHLLLDDGARAYSDPKLEVSNNDVSCTHGAAIRHCDEEQLFFLRARGIDEQTARSALVIAFLRQKLEIDGEVLSV